MWGCTESFSFCHLDTYLISINYLDVSLNSLYEKAGENRDGSVFTRRESRDDDLPWARAGINRAATRSGPETQDMVEKRVVEIVERVGRPLRKEIQAGIKRTPGI